MKILRGTETVLLVDDKDSIIDSAQKILKTLGLLAKEGKEAIEVYQKTKIKLT